MNETTFDDKSKMLRQMNKDIKNGISQVAIVIQELEDGSTLFVYSRPFIKEEKDK